MENFKKYIKDNEKVEKHFFTGLNEKTLEQKFQYLKNHFDYYIMNSWNRLSTIANNVKIYNLGLSSEHIEKYFEICSVDDYFIKDLLYLAIEEFIELSNTLDVYFNGRSGGYLVLIPKFNYFKKWTHVYDIYNLSNIEDYESYLEYKKDENISSIDIENAYYTIKAFDKLCDVLRSNLINIIEDAKFDEYEETITQKRRYVKIWED